MVSPSDYDALADLFLTGGGMMGNVSGPVPERAAAQRSAPDLSIVNSEATMTSTTAQPPRAPSVPGTVPSTLIEGVVLGHLPVLAAAWVTQHARRLSEERREPVALVRLQDNRCDIDLVGAATTESQAQNSLTDALHAAASATHTWIVRVHQDSEAYLANAADRLTILSGADEAAVVSTYETLKFLVEQARNEDESRAETPGRFRVMVMGANDEKARQAREKLTQTTASFLGKPAEIVVGPQKMVPTPMANLFSGTGAPSLGELLSAIQAAHAPGNERSLSRIGQAATADRARTVPVDVPVTPPANPAPMAWAAAAPVATPPAAADQMYPRPHPAAVHARAQATSPAAELSQHVPGLTRLPIHCPYAPDVELAVTGGGDFHLLSRCESGQSPAETISRLVATSSWLNDHIALVRLAVPQARIAGAMREPSMHLFTDEPKSVRRLLDSGVRLHVLLEARVGNQTALVSRELN